MIKRRQKTLVALTIAVLLILAGWFRGEIQIVVTKATAICMECIGIG